ncbi:MAG: glycosyltransferase [Rhodocyclaceae bacterium]|nr:glycosyltransferase [Rhodocyclaceae bacterium]
MSLPATAGGVACSVCIANYNGIDLIDACIESVRSQDCGFVVEIIVHDDASTDGSAAHIASRHPDVRLIESRENAGFCVANNRMAAMASGDYLLLLNNDAALLPGALAALMAEARRLGRPAILGLPQYDADSGELLDIGSRLDPFFNAVPNRDPQRNEVAMVAGACLWLPKTLWDELGGFPEWFGSVAEDLYLCCRARLAGHPVRALGHAGYRHHVGRSLGGGKPLDGRLVTSFRRRALSERNKTYVMLACCPAPVLQLLFPLHLGLLLIEGSLLSILNVRLDYLARIYLPVIPALLRQRRALAALRREAMRRRRPGETGFFSAFELLPYKLRMLLRHGLPRLT